MAAPASAWWGIDISASGIHSGSNNNGTYNIYTIYNIRLTWFPGDELPLGQPDQGRHLLPGHGPRPRGEVAEQVDMEPGQQARLLQRDPLSSPADSAPKSSIRRFVIT